MQVSAAYTKTLAPTNVFAETRDQQPFESFSEGQVARPVSRQSK